MCTRWIRNKIGLALLFLLTNGSTVQAAPGNFAINSPGNTTTNGPTLQTSRQTFKWDASSGASNYRLNVRDVTLSDTGPVTNYAAATTSLDVNLVNGHSYKWNVTSFASANQTGLSTDSSNSRWFKIGTVDLLIAGYPVLSTTVPAPGQTFSITYTVTNTGTADSIACSNRIQIKLDGSNATTVEDWFSMGPVAAGKSATTTSQLTIPNSAATDNYYTMYIIVDSKGTNLQSNTANDIFTALTALYVRPPQPNLVPYVPAGWSDAIVCAKSDKTTDDNSILTSDNIYVSWAIINSGETSITTPFATQLFIDDNLFDAYINFSLPLNYVGSKQGINIGKLSPGTHKIRIKTDSTSNIQELNEKDNEFTKQIVVNGIPVPEIPTGLSASYSFPNNKVTLTWTDTSNESGYIIQKQLPSGLIVTFTAAQNAITFEDTSVTVDANYCYSIVATNGSGNSSSSDSICIKPKQPVPPVAKINADSTAAYGQITTFKGENSVGEQNLSYSWQFGDGQTSTARNPSHSYYPANGTTTYKITLTVSDRYGTSAAITTITISGQSFGNSPNTSKSLDPVNLANGNFIYQHTDLNYPSRGFPVHFSRFYNSRDTVSKGNPIGYGWTHNFNIKLTDLVTNIIVTLGDGHQEAFISTNGYFKGELGIYNYVTNINGRYTLITKDGLRYNFDDQNRYSSLVDRNNNSLILNYSSDGFLSEVIDTVGRINRMEYNSSKCLIRLIDPLGRTNSFEYDSSTNLVSATDPNGGVTRYEYDGGNQMTAAINPNGNRFVSNSYDSDRHVVSTQKDALLFETKFIYDFDKHVTVVSNSYGLTRHFHDDRLRITNITDSLGNQSSFEYDDNNNRIAATDNNSNTFRTSYDANGNVVFAIDPMKGITTVGYNDLNDPIARTNALGFFIGFGYDPRGNLTTTTNENGGVIQFVYDQWGQVQFLIDEIGRQTTNTYNSNGDLIAVLDAGGYTNRFVYDGIGRKREHVDGNNHTNLTVFDGCDNILFSINALKQTNSFHFDLNNNLILSVDPKGNSITNTYDEKDRLIKTETSLGAVFNTYDSLNRKTEFRDSRTGRLNMGYNSEGRLLFLTNATGNITSYCYDPNGNVIYVTNALGQITANKYDSLNRLICTVKPLNRTNLFYFDLLGRLTETVNANNVTNASGYDTQGRLVSSTNSLGTTEESVVIFTYDRVGNRTSITDPNGQVTTNSYDALNRLVRTKDASSSVGYMYDGVGNKVGQTDGNGENQFLYDKANRLTFSTIRRSTYRYDLAGNMQSMEDQLGASTWQYDSLNRLTNADDSFGNRLAFVLDANGNRTKLIFPGGKVVSYEYDLSNRMISVSDWHGNTTRYEYDKIGHLISTTNGNGTFATYMYDEGGRLNAFTNFYASSKPISTYELTLDALGNVKKMNQVEPLVPLISTTNISYSYLPGNVLSTVNGTSIFQFDLNGNLHQVSTERDVGRYFYDSANQLLKLATESFTNLMEYDGLGHRLSLSRNGAKRRFLVDSSKPLSQIVAEIDASGNITDYYIYGMGLVSTIKASGEVRYFHYNPRGDTMGLTDSTGALTEVYSYDSFGNVLNKEGTFENRFLFLGKYGIMDDGNGLVFVRARYYMPSIGKFLTRDPLVGADTDTQSLNRYSYSLNNPVLLVDISGLSPQDGSFGGSWLSNFGNAQAGYWEAIIVDPAKAIFNFVFHPFKTGDAIAYSATHFQDTIHAAIQGVKNDISSGDSRRQSHVIGTFVSLLIPFGIEADGVKAASTISIAEKTGAANIAEKLAIDEASAGAAGTSERIMEGRIRDPMFPEDQWAKMQYIHEGLQDDIIVHFWENLQTGAKVGFKIKR